MSFLGIPADNGVRLECTRLPDEYQLDPDEPAYDSRWMIDDDVISASIECESAAYILSRNMDEMKHKYAWRLSHYDLSPRVPRGHTYGRTALEALAELSCYDRCQVTSVRRRR